MFDDDQDDEYGSGWEEESDFNENEFAEDDFNFNCPECGTLLHEEASACSNCGYFILDSDRTYPSLVQAPWFKFLGIIGVIAVVLTLVIPLLLG